MRWTRTETFHLTRLIYQRCLAPILLIAFLNAAFEFKPLLGEHGLLPVPLFTKAVPFSASPSLFFFAPNDTAFSIAAWLGVLLACLALTGLADRYSTGRSPCSSGPGVLDAIDFRPADELDYILDEEHEQHAARSLHRLSIINNLAQILQIEAAGSGPRIRAKRRILRRSRHRRGLCEFYVRLV